AYKRVWLDIFDNDFTELFDSKMFGENYGKLVAKELELTKHSNNIMNVMLQSANLPNKQEIDEVYKEVYSLRKRISKLESEARTKTKPKKGTDDGNIW
ncbi:MAG: poly(R)-hydroxyalkanoic acid synthase subunit PhaE, partial [Nitrosopumilaceae archaeon]